MPSARPCRVVLLLDLDCFYAQCERVRLGLDGENAELALLQWNSVLAVTYPARRYGIKRGDSWEQVRTKSNGKCLALHLPILKANDNNNSNDDDGASNINSTANVKEAYQQTYVLTAEQRREIVEKEVGVQRHGYEGKACLERYRLASSRIFSIILESLNKEIGKNIFILERASIDEMFVDVTEYCWEAAGDRISTAEQQQQDVMNETVIVGEGECPQQQADDRDIQLALERGCVVAKLIRNAVLQELGFTLSAGVSINKVVAKLGASYGKPNGQAVIFPNAIPKVMEETKIRKVRNFGGKIGKKVKALLPENEETMGSIARLLSLPVLVQEMGPETGKMVYDACRGIDHEPVKETAGALVKSITAFKSFSRTALSSDNIVKWLTLLATDVVSRVEQDCARNQRYPQSLSIQYTFSKDDNERVSRSVRIPFPRAGEEQKRSKLVQRSREAILAKEGPVYMYRVGLCATDFDVRLREGISSYFLKGSNPKRSPGKDKAGTSSMELPKDEPEEQRHAHDADISSKDEEFARRLQQQYNCCQDGPGERTTATPSVATRSPCVADACSPSSQATVNGVVDKDLEYARRLQASYDRENQVLSAAESKSSKKARLVSYKRVRPSKKMRLENFFGKSTK